MLGLRMSTRAKRATLAACLSVYVVLGTGLRCPDFEAEVVEYELSEVRIDGAQVETRAYGNRLEIAGDPDDLAHFVARDGIEFVYHGAASTAEVEP